MLILWHSLGSMAPEFYPFVTRQTHLLVFEEIQMDVLTVYPYQVFPILPANVQVLQNRVL